MVEIRLPAVLAGLAGAAVVSVDASTVLEAVRALSKFNSGLPDKVISEKLEPRPHVLIFVNDEEIRLLQGVRTALRGGEILQIVPAVSGG